MSALQPDEAVRALLADLSAAGEGHVVSMSAPPAAGRREVLSRVAGALSREGRTAVLLDLPTRDLDSGGLALVQAGRAAGSPALAEARDCALPFGEKVDLVLGGLGHRAVGLVYAPWLRPSEERELGALRSGRGVLDVLAQLKRRMPVLIALALPLPLSRTVRLAKFAARQEWVEGEFPASLAPRALTLLEEARRCSRLEVRLAVGLLSLEVPQDEVRKLLSGQFPLEDLVTAFWTALHQSRPDLLRAWELLAASRRPLPVEAASNVLGSEVFQDPLIQHCLTFQREGRVVLHGRLRPPALRAMADSDHDGLDRWREANRRLALQWREQRERALAAGAGWDALEADMDTVFHHVESGGSWDEVRDRIYFQDQLCLLGRTLSKTWRRYAEAAACFQRARELDPEDAYAWHYEAYNLARRQPPPTPEVSHGFARAVDLDPTNVWYHQRLVRWLLFRGRPREARLAWARAVDQTGDQAGWDGANPWYYHNLHWLVACRAMDSGELALARSALDRVPPQLLQTDADLRRASRLLDAFERAEQGQLTYPLDEEVREGLPPLWTRPRRLPDRSESSGEPRVSWYAARVESVDPDHLYLRVGRPIHNGTTSVECYWEDMPRTRFQQALVDEDPDAVQAGRFFEAGEYGPSHRLLIRLFPVLEAEVPEIALP